MIQIAFYTENGLGIRYDNKEILINASQNLIEEYENNKNLLGQIETQDGKETIYTFGPLQIKKSYKGTHCLLQIREKNSEIALLIQGKPEEVNHIEDIPSIQALIIKGNTFKNEHIERIKSIKPQFTVPIQCNQQQGIDIASMIMLHRISTPKYFIPGQVLGLL